MAYSEDSLSLCKAHIAAEGGQPRITPLFPSWGSGEPDKLPHSGTGFLLYGVSGVGTFWRGRASFPEGAPLSGIRHAAIFFSLKEVYARIGSHAPRPFGADLLASLETALKSGRVTHFHACANNRGAPGDGIVPWDAVMQMLKQYGYAGHITMETFAPGGLDASWVNVHGTPDEVALRGLHFLQRYF